MPFEIVRNDITKMDVDAVVNAANPALKAGGGVCGAIFEAAGAEVLQRECDAIGGCETGGAVITKGYALPARYIIHTVGPVWRGGNFGEAELLASCYTNALTLALENGCGSVAFPLIASGVYGYPKDAALRVAVSAIGDFLMRHDMTVYLVVYDRQAYALSGKLFAAIQHYIDDNYVEEHLVQAPRRFEESEKELFERAQPRASMLRSPPAPLFSRSRRNLSDVVDQLDETFSQTLLRLIDEKGKSDVETYKRANIDRKLFSKIRSNKDYNPGKRTAVALAIALELNFDETQDLLAKAGYTLSHSSRFDVIVEYFIEQRNHDIFEINEALFAFDQPLLGAS